MRRYKCSRCGLDFFVVELVNGLCKECSYEHSGKKELTRLFDKESRDLVEKKYQEKIETLNRFIRLIKHQRDRWIDKGRPMIDVTKLNPYKLERFIK